MKPNLDTMLLPDEIKRHLQPGDPFDQVMALQGESFRDVPGRKTVRVELGGNSYFIKQHFGVGWAEIFKNLLTLRWPIISARTEKDAIQKMDEIGIATTPLVAFGERGSNPARRQSFLITRDLGDIISLEDLCGAWKQNPPETHFKRQLVVAVAKLARKLHENGLNHRDFYLCHLCLDGLALKNSEIKLYLIDLHRMLSQRAINRQASMKDIAALYFSSMDFSSMDLGLSTRDYLRFKYYYAKDFPTASASFWQQVLSRANKLYSKFHSDKFQNRLRVEKSALGK